MPSSFAWVDFDEASRRRMLDIIDKFRDQDTVDELGIGTVRDAFANYFFPGTSTIQTRARYFLFIPWIYQRIESKEISSAKVIQNAREAEFQLIDALIEAGVAENEGVIGRISRRKLQRLPSNIYWVGLSQWGIRKFPGTQDQYHRYLDHYYRKKRNRLFTDDNEPIDGHLDFNWDPHIPGPPEKFPQGATMELRRSEARYLQDRITESHGESLLAATINAPAYHETDYFWENEMLVRNLPLSLKETINHARDFAQTMHGAVLLYNLMLAQAQKNQELVDSYIGELDDWVSNIAKRHNELIKWHSNMKRFWDCEALRNARIPESTKRFVETWCALIYQNMSSDGISEHTEARDLIREREVRLKRNRSRLENNRYLELWRGSSGTAMMEYRWTQVSRIVRDIREGL